MNIITVFVTGLFAGGLSCMAVQGGLLATTLAHNKEEKALPIVLFLTARLVAYTAVGFVLGTFGSALQLSLGTRVIIQLAVIAFMMGTALNLLQVHPLFRYFALQPPRFITKRIFKESKNESLFAPLMLGAMTVFIPCGATQAMMAFAITTGSPALGALTMFAFILGTSPLFFAVGLLAHKLGAAFNEKFNIAAALIILFIAFYSLDGTLALAGVQTTPGTVIKNLYCSITFCDLKAVQGAASDTGSPSTNPVSEATIFIDQTRYVTNPDTVTVKAGSKVRLNLVNRAGGGCIQAFTIPSLNVQEVVPVGTRKAIDIIAPNQPGPLAFMCSMGMYRGVINVL